MKELEMEKQISEQTEVIQKPLTKEDFAKAYEKLVKEYGFQIAFQPVWKQSFDTGTFSLVIQSIVVENPKREG